MRRVFKWEVQLAISGAISVSGSLSLQVEKGFERPFTTDVSLKKHQDGILVELTVRASNQEEANDAAVSFVGRMVDLLCHWTDIPLYLSIHGRRFRPLEDHARRIVEEDEWFDAFRISREFATTRVPFSRALSWYRKGLTIEDPVDRLIAFWSALEGVASTHAGENERARRGAVNQVCDCFDQLWEESAKWKVIPNDPQFINQVHDWRNGISHGFIAFDVETILTISENLPKLRALCHEFLQDWERHAEVALNQPGT